MASIKCGKCQQTHASVGEVRECYNVTPADLQMAEQRADLAHFVATDPAWRQPQVWVGGRSFGKISQQLAQIEARVPAGRYAVEVDGMLRFYVVDKPTEGRWSGYTFVKVQASDELHPVRISLARLTVLSAIAQDPHEAMLRYGREIGKCGHCGRTLTNDESRAIGIGPVCARSVA